MSTAATPQLIQPSTQPPQQSAAGSVVTSTTQTGDKTEKTNWTPTAKVSVGVLAGAVTMILSAILAPHWKNWTSQEMTPAVGAAFTSIITFIIQYCVPDNRASA